MKHGDHSVDLVRSDGMVVGSKPRRDVDKRVDLYHTVFTFVLTPDGGVVLGRIPTRSDLPNLYAEQLGVPVATIRRSGESAAEASRRSVAAELGVDDAKTTLLGEGLLELDDDRRTYFSAYHLVTAQLQQYRRADIAELVTLTPSELNARVVEHPERFAPTMLRLWQQYRGRLGDRDE